MTADRKTIDEEFERVWMILSVLNWNVVVDKVSSKQIWFMSWKACEKNAEQQELREVKNGS